MIFRVHPPSAPSYKPIMFLLLFSAVCSRFWVNCYWIVSFVHSFNPDQKIYADAQKFCETATMNGFKTGRLFEPKTQSFNDKVHAKSKVVFGKKNTWIGINPKGGVWVYTSSGTELEFQNWRPHYPAHGFECVSLYYNSNGQWIDNRCSQPKLL